LTASERVERYGAGVGGHVHHAVVDDEQVLAGAFAFGAPGLALLTRAKPKHDIAGLQRVAAMSAKIIAGLGYGEDVVCVIETDDPDHLLAQLKALAPGTSSPKPAQFEPRGSKRPVLETTFRELYVAAPTPVSVIALEQGAPFGGVDVNVDGCTLCHSCVTACPTGALSDNSERPMLRFTESACVQCGLCAATCPEKVITLKPQLDFTAWREPARLLKEEEPFCCIRCATPFATKSMIDKIAGKLSGKHWMFSGENARRLDVVRMCEKCRVEAVMNEGFDPYGAPQRPPVMTSEDYLKARDAQGDDPVGS
jgi:ferredoxin